MRLGRSRLLATLLVLLGLFATVVFIRRRRDRARAALEDYLAGAALDVVAPNDDDEESFIELSSLEEARSMDHTAAIMQGGGGAQIYLTVPAKYVLCEQPALLVLLKLLDALELNEPSRASLSFELAPIGSGIYAEMGGGSIVDGIWLHPRLEATGVKDAVAAVIAGARPVDGIKGEFSANSRKTRP